MQNTDIFIHILKSGFSPCQSQTVLPWVVPLLQAGQQLLRLQGQGQTKHSRNRYMIRYTRNILMCLRKKQPLPSERQVCPSYSGRREGSSSLLLSVSSHSTGCPCAKQIAVSQHNVQIIHKHGSRATQSEHD